MAVTLNVYQFEKRLPRYIKGARKGTLQRRDLYNIFRSRAKELITVVNTPDSVFLGGAKVQATIDVKSVYCLVRIDVCCELEPIELSFQMGEDGLPTQISSKLSSLNYSLPNFALAVKPLLSLARKRRLLLEAPFGIAESYLLAETDEQRETLLAVWREKQTKRTSPLELALSSN